MAFCYIWFTAFHSLFILDYKLNTIQSPWAEIFPKIITKTYETYEYLWKLKFFCWSFGIHSFSKACIFAINVFRLIYSFIFQFCMVRRILLSHGKEMTELRCAIKIVPYSSSSFLPASFRCRPGARAKQFTWVNSWSQLYFLPVHHERLFINSVLVPRYNFDESKFMNTKRNYNL